MQELAKDVWMLDGFPRNMVNTYVLDDVLIDAGTKSDRKRILGELKGRKLSAHALTHGHADHQGSSKAVCETFDIPLWCGEGDADAVTEGSVSSLVPNTLFTRLLIRPFGDLLVAGPAYSVSRRLREGDLVGSFTVVETPGHTPGHISFWREHDRTLIVGDTLFGMSMRTFRAGLNEPFTFGTVDVKLNRQSARKLAALEPELACFGHGPPLRNPDEFSRFVGTLS